MSTDNDVYNVLMAIREDLGEIKATLKSTAGVLEGHIEEDKIWVDKVRRIELDEARQRGAMRVWATIATTAGAIAGALLGAASNYFSKGSH